MTCAAELPWRGGGTVSAVRILGVILLLAGSAGTAYATWAIFHRGRPADVAFAVAAPVAALIALAGLVLAFVPGFLG